MSALRSLYLHIPFCERKCEYCDFASVAGTARQHEYVDGLRRELRQVAAGLPGIELDTVFLGGGTPGLLDPGLLAAVLDEVRAGFALAPDAEITLEANPSSTDEARASVWLEAGCTRVSLGVQSLEPDILAFLGRVHDGVRALEAVADVRRAGFVRVNCDLIYAVPGLDDHRWTRTVERLLELDPGHLSCYELTVEEGTPLATRVAAGRVAVVDADRALDQHWRAVELCAAAGYAQYEVSGFARAGHECRHNQVYWANGFYLAAGVAAHGHLPPQAAETLGIARPPEGAVAVRYWHPRGIARYLSSVAAGGLGIAGTEAIDQDTNELERIMVGLRRSAGVELQARHASAAAQLAADGLVSVDGVRCRATRRGQELLNHVALRLVDAA
ncbi:MAG: radical SAM family heme chaperone HemW [Chloroflexi bacterium]|nr:MAG: radical SAM family heme chaperone HemW [Chloroflexota bacterium]